MHKFLSERAAELARLTLSIRSGLEQAEAKVPPLNDQLNELAMLGITSHQVEAAAAGQQGAAALAVDSGACCRDGHGHAHHVSEVAARRRDDVPVDAADPPAHGDGRESRPTGTVPEGIVPSRAQLELAAARRC